MARSGLFQAMLEAILGTVDGFSGQSITELTTQLDEAETTTIDVVSTLRFGEDTDDAGDALLLIGGEIVYAEARTLTSFGTLTRGVSTTRVRTHPPGTLVYDISRNRTALDFVRRGFFVRTARDADLDVIGRNLGLHKCPGLTEDVWRQLIEVMAYLPNQPTDSFKQVLDVFPGVGNYRIVEDVISKPCYVLIEITMPSSNGLRGKFYLNSGEHATTNGLATVQTAYDINNVLGVYLDTEDVRRGNRDGHTNYANGFTAPNTVNLNPSPGPIGTAVIIDYGAFTAHYLPENETKRYPGDGDFFPYLSDPSAIVRCLLNQVRAAGVKVEAVATV